MSLTEHCDRLLAVLKDLGEKTELGSGIEEKNKIKEEFESNKDNKYQEEADSRDSDQSDF